MTALRPEGKTLATRLDREAIPVDEAVRIASEIAEALVTAHAKGDVHGDLTPSNVILAPSGHVKVVDFLPASGDNDPRADILALGRILHEMLAGNTDVPELLQHVMRKMLAERPEERYQLVHEVRTDLAHVAALGEPVTAQSRRSLPLGWIGTVLLVGLTAMGAWWLVSSREPAPERELTSLAVLPLKNLSMDPLESDYLSEGITRAVITKLTQAGLRVTPWDTARRYGERPERAEVIARELEVDAVLVGTFELLGSRILTTLSLVEADSGLQSWADEFEEPFEDLFQVQRRIALGAARSLKRELTGEEEEALATPESRSVNAYDLYLQGVHIFQEGGEDSTSVAHDYFMRALELDSGLAEAHVGLGAVHYARYTLGWGGLASLNRAESSYEKALELNPRLMRARRGLILVSYFKGQSEPSLRQGELAERYGRADDVETLLTRGAAFGFGGFLERAHLLVRRALVMDPGNADALYYVVVFSWRNEPQIAIETGNAFFRRFGDDPEIHQYVAWAHQRLGDFDAAREHYHKAMGAPETFFYAGLLYDRLGEQEQAETIWRQGVELFAPMLEASPDNAHLGLLLAGLHGLLGDEAAFLAHEERALAVNVNAWAIDFVVAVHARRGETERASELLRQSVRGGLANPGLYLVLTTMLPLESAAYDTFIEERAALQQSLRERYR